MNLKEYITEEFAGYAKVSTIKEPVPYYKNPTFSELMEIAKFNTDTDAMGYNRITRVRRAGNVRFILDYSKKVMYAFSAAALHYEIGADLGYTNGFNRDSTVMNIFYGEAKLNHEERKLDFVYSDSLSFKDPKFLERMSKQDWTFGDKWFTMPVKKILASIKQTNKVYKGKD